MSPTDLILSKTIEPSWNHDPILGVNSCMLIKIYTLIDTHILVFSANTARTPGRTAYHVSHHFAFRHQPSLSPFLTLQHLRMLREPYSRKLHSSLILSAHSQQAAAHTACATSTMGFPVRDRISRSGLESRVKVEIRVKRIETR